MGDAGIDASAAPRADAGDLPLSPSRSGGDQPVTVPAALSPSRAADFQNCPLLFRFRTIDRLPEAPGEAAVRGTLVHAALEELFTLPATDRTPAAARGLLAGSWERVVAAEPDASTVLGERSVEEWLAQAEPLIEAYFGLEDPRALEPAERELRVDALTSDGSLALRGYVDRLDVAPDGRTRVVDYKTGRAPADAFVGKALFQMRFYALALWRSGGPVPTQLKLIYLGDGTTVVDAPDEEALEATERKVLALWSAITEAVERRDFRPRPSRLCDWCDHRSRCPEFGGQPPPLPLLTLGRPPAADSAPATQETTIR